MPIEYRHPSSTVFRRIGLYSAGNVVRALAKRDYRIRSAGTAAGNLAGHLQSRSARSGRFTPWQANLRYPALGGGRRCGDSHGPPSTWFGNPGRGAGAQSF